MGYGRAGVKEETMLFAGIVLIAVSLSIAIGSKLRRKIVSKTLFAILGGTLLLGLILYVWSFAYMESEDQILGAILGAAFIIFGALLIYMCIFSFIEMSRCKEKVIGRYLKKELIHHEGFSKTFWSYTLIFEYTYNYKLIKTRSRQLFNPYYIDNNFKKNKTYEIYINPTIPESCIVHRKTQFKQILGFVFSFFFVLIGVFIVLAS